MKSSFRAIAAIIYLLAFACPGALGQSGSEYESFASAAREQSMLFRGRQGISYSHIAYNGTFYWSTPEFQRGEIMYNGKLYSGVYLNIDAAAHHILVRYAPGMPSVIVPKEYVPYFSIGKDRYVNMAMAGLCEDPYCIMQQLSDGDAPVYRRVRKLFSSTSSNVNGRPIGGYDPSYREDFTNYFRLYEQYFTVSGGSLRKISRRKALKLIGYGQ